MTRGRKPLPEGERMVVLAVRVPPEMYAEITEWAKRAHMSKSQVMRYCIESWFGSQKDHVA